MLRQDYSRSLRETRNLPEDVGRMINYYAYYTPEEEFLYLAVDLLNLMNEPLWFEKTPYDKVKINSENIKLLVDYLKFKLKNSFQEFLDNYSEQEGTLIYFVGNLVNNIPDAINTHVFYIPTTKMKKIIDNFLLIRGRNEFYDFRNKIPDEGSEGFIQQNQSLIDFYRQFPKFSKFPRPTTGRNVNVLHLTPPLKKLE